jgi:two-component system cell cycle response regulator
MVLTGPQLGERKRLDENAVEIGRDPGADLVLADPDVAWRHARVVPGAEGWSVVDLGNGAPVEVNGIRVASRLLLSADDRVQIGATMLRFELHGPVERAFDAVVEERLWRDELTGLMSRRRMEIELGSRLDGVRAQGGTVALAVIDLDQLKQINDRHGHLVGGRVISEVGRAIARTLPAGAFACRLGGDEFAVVLPGGDIDAITTLGTALCAAVASLALTHDGEPLLTGISVGVAVAPDQGDHPFSLLRAADDALMRAKRAGRGHVSR